MPSSLAAKSLIGHGHTRHQDRRRGWRHHRGMLYGDTMTLTTNRGYNGQMVFAPDPSLGG
jgi:hypothetical protein